MRQLTAIGCTLVMAVLGMVGCSTLSDVVQEKDQGGGTVQVYPIDTDQAWKIAMTVFRWEGSDAIEEHRDQSYMLTSSGMSLVSAGAVCGRRSGCTTTMRQRGPCPGLQYPILPLCLRCVAWRCGMPPWMCLPPADVAAAHAVQPERRPHGVRAPCAG
jgi:hypothetical protein